MKHLKVVVLVIAFALAGVYCDDGAAGNAVGLGGADVTPEDVIEQVSDIDIAEAEDVLVAAGEEEIEKALEVYEGTEEATDAAEEDTGEAVSEDQGESIVKEEGDVVDETSAEEVKESTTDAAEKEAAEAAEKEAREKAVAAAAAEKAAAVAAAAEREAKEKAEAAEKEAREKAAAAAAEKEAKEKAAAEAAAEKAAAEAAAAEQEAAEKAAAAAAAEKAAAEAAAAEQEAAEKAAAAAAAEKEAKDKAAAIEEPAEEAAEEEAVEEPVVEVAEEEAAEGEVDIKGMKVELDPTVGRWFKVETKDLDSVSASDRKKNKDKIKDYRKDLKKLRDDLKAANAKNDNDKAQGKAKGTAKGKDKDSNDEAKIQAQIDELLAKIEEAKDKIGYGSKQKGIYTYWQDENLRLMVRNVETAGWYRLAIVAKNYGNLPKWYDQFSVSIINESEGADVGGISIKASDNVYHRGTVLVYLEKGDTDFNLVWKNDAFKENQYDANIQIKRVTLRYAKKNNLANKRLVRNAHEYTVIDGRFFWDNKSAWTNWQDQTIGFSFPELEPGKYEITIMAKNYGNLPLPDGYDNFVVAVDADGTSGEAMISAAQKGWRKGSVVLDLTGGTDVFLTWLNDQYKEGVYDTNIQFKKIFLKRVGDSERSALAAYLLGTRSGNRVLMSGILVVLVGFIALISVWNRKRVRAQA